jgi:hypothetical protein
MGVSGFIKLPWKKVANVLEIECAAAWPGEQNY